MSQSRTLFAREQPMSAGGLAVKLLKILVLTYAVLWVYTRLFLQLVVEPSQITEVPYHGQSAHIFVVAFFVFFTPLLYGFNCLLARQWIRPQWPTLILYMGATFACGVLCEIAFDSAFAHFLGRPAWEYRIWPVHNGYTSGATAVVWAMYGFYLYFFHRMLEIRRSPMADSIPAKGVLIAIDAMVLETLANSFSLITFNVYYFYYFRPDLMNFTTWEIFIPYALCGLGGAFLLKLLDQKHYPKVLIGLAFYAVGLVEVFVWE